MLKIIPITLFALIIATFFIQMPDAHSGQHNTQSEINTVGEYMTSQEAILKLWSAKSKFYFENNKIFACNESGDCVELYTSITGHTTKLNGHETKLSNHQSEIANLKAEIQTLKTALNNYLTKSAASSTYATKSSLGTYATKTDVYPKLSFVRDSFIQGNGTSKSVAQRSILETNASGKKTREIRILAEHNPEAAGRHRILRFLFYSYDSNGVATQQGNAGTYFHKENKTAMMTLSVTAGRTQDIEDIIDEVFTDEDQY
jgi:hypothetical protein